MEAAAKHAGAIVNSVMLGAIAGSGRLPIPAEAFEAAIKARRQGGRKQSARLPGRARGRARQLPVPLVPSRQAPRQADAGRSRGGSRRAAGGRACVRHRRRAPPRRLPGSRLRAALSRSARAVVAADARAGAGGKLAHRDRAPPRGAHVVRGRDPRRRGEDCARAFPPHRGRDRRQGPALRHHGIPQARHRGTVPGAAAAACARDRRRIRRSAAGSARSISAWS